MYLTQSIIDGLRILGFDKDTIRKISREKSLEEIFLSTLFLNYLIVLIIYMAGLIGGGFNLQGREINMPVFFGLLMVYPFAYNLVVYTTYGFFGIMAELLDKKKTVKPLISVGFHTAIAYTILIYIIAMLTTIDIAYGAFLFSAFMLYFIYTMFLAISTIYGFSLSQTLIVIFIPFLILSIVLLIALFIFPDVLRSILAILFA